MEKDFVELIAVLVLVAVSIPIGGVVVTVLAYLGAVTVVVLFPLLFFGAVSVVFGVPLWITVPIGLVANISWVLYIKG